MAAFTATQANAIASSVKATPPGAARALDPGNPADAAAITAFLELSGKTPQTHPALYEDVAKLAKASPGGTFDAETHKLEIVDQGCDAAGRATARVWYLDRAGSYLSGTVALVLDGDSGAPLAMGYANRVGGGLCPAATRSATAKAAPAKITTVGFFHSQPHPDAPPSFGMMTKSAAVKMNTVDANVTAPVSLKQAEVRIALGRLQGGEDADYFYVQNTINSPPLLVPFVGTVNTQQSLANLDNTGHFTSGLVTSTQLYSLNGNSYSAHNNNQPLNSQVTGNASTNVVSWSFPFDPQQQPSALGPSLVYAPLGAANDTPSAFFFEFQIPVTNPVTPLYVFNVCSVDWPDQPSVNCYQIQGLEFWWHCLAEGTDITLADGSKLAIEAVDNTKRVRTGSGGDLAVEATTRGTHKPAQAHDKTHGVYELTTEAGRKLVLTGGHPVATPDGLKAACDLGAGTRVLSEDGTDTVKVLKPIQASGVFCNLKLVDAADRAKGLGHSVGSFIANGLVVGDVISLRQMRQNNLHSLDYMRARLPSRQHVDYASTLATILQDNRRYGGTF